MTDAIVLASASPRRHDLLTMLRIKHIVDPVSIPEERSPGEDPTVYAVRLARAKARAGSERYPGRWVLGADTVVVVDTDVLEKPASAADAEAMLARLAGRSHRVVTACALARDGQVHERVEETLVWFRHLPPETIRAYVATGEPMDKAGAYGIQGQGAVLVERIEGDYFTVMGLPLGRVVEMLDAAGIGYAFTR